MTAAVYGLVVVSSVIGFGVLPFTKLVMDSVQGLLSSQEDFDRMLGETFLGRLFQGSTAITVIAVAAVLLLVVKLVSILIAAFNQYLNEMLIGKVAQDMRADMFGHIIELPEDYLAEHPVGELSARCVQNVNASVGIYTSVFFLPIVTILTLLFSIGYILFLEWRLGLLALAFAPLYYLVVGKLGPAIEKKTKGVSTQFANVQQDLQETLSAAREIKAHGSEARERAEFDGNLEGQYKAQLDYSRWQLLANQSTRVLSEAAPLAILVVGALLISSGGGITLGDLIVVFTFVPTLLGSMSAVSGMRLSYLSSMTFAREVWDILQEPTESVMFGGEKELRVPDKVDPEQPIIEFENVYMTYPRSGYQVSDMTFRIYPGQAVAVVGQGGAGKSTVFNILSKLYDYDRGSVRLFGQELRELTVPSVRSALGMMVQFPFFFQRSYRENVLYGIDARDANAEARMKAICTELEMDEVVASMPQGYDTTITSRGANLSGSQQKRTALSRVLMKDPPVLLLDEPLSGLSPDQRREVSETIKALRGKKTVLVITHDLELIEGMDLILVFKRVERAPEEEEAMAAMALDAMPAMPAMPPAGVAKGAVIGKGEGMPKGAVAIAKGAAVGKGEGMPIAKGAVAAKGTLAGKAEGMPAPKGGDAPPPEQREHGIIVEQGSWAELSQRGHAFRILAGMEQPRA